jgi:hypothetical protein
MRNSGFAAFHIAKIESPLRSTTKPPFFGSARMSVPSAPATELLLFGLIISGQIACGASTAGETYSK